MTKRRRSLPQRWLDFFTFPLRALVLYHEDRWGLSCLATERFDFVARYVEGRCLDYGCGPHNRFIEEFCGGEGIGVDVFAYDGLAPEQILDDPTKLPFEDGSFGTVTFIANLNHVPERYRDTELAEAWRVLRPGGKVIITMGRGWVEVMTHQVVWLFDKIFKTHNDLDNERGMDEEEHYFVTPQEIRERLLGAGFRLGPAPWFWTQWWLNRLYVGYKD